MKKYTNRKFANRNMAYTEAKIEALEEDGEAPEPGTFKKIAPPPQWV